MSRWANRALRVTLLTGGLLAVGTGVASASDPLGDGDLDVVVPVTVTDNALGVLGDAPTAGGLELPAPSQDLTLDLGSVAVSVPVTIGGNDAAVGSGGATQPDTGPAPGTSAPADVAVPVTVVGNGIGVLGDAEASGTAPATPEGAVTVPVTVCGNGVGVLGDAVGGCAPVAGTGSGSPEAAGPLDDLLDVDAPVTVCGNGVGVLGDVAGACTPAGTGGDSGGALVDVDVPVTVCGNGAGVLGDAAGGCTAAGTPGSGSGNGSGGDGGGDGSGDGGIDVDVPVLVCGNGIGLLGDAGGLCALPGGGTPGTGTPGSGTPGSGTPGTGGGGSDGGIDVDVPVTVCGVGLGLLGSGTADCTPPTGPTGPEGPGTPRHPAPEQPGPQQSGHQHSGLVAPVAGALTGAGSWTATRDGSAPSAAAGPGSGQLAYTGGDLGVLGAGLLVLLAGTGLTLAARRRSGTA